MDQVSLAPAPASPVDGHGQPALGAYLGHVANVAWDALRGPSARGWLYRRLHHKRWHYCSIANERVMFAAAVIDVGLLSSAFFYVFDRARGELLVDRSLTSRPGRATFSPSPGEGANTRFRDRTTEIVLRRGPGSTSWQIQVDDGPLLLDATLDARGAPPTLCAIARIGDGGVANCTHKTVGLPASGRLRVGETTFDLAGGWGALDHTSGLLARDTRWRWASGNGPRARFNLVDGFNGPIENVLWLGDRVVPIGQVTFTYERARTTAPWHIVSSDGRLELELTPEGERRQDVNLVLARSWYVQPFGPFRGVFREEGQAPVDLAGVVGVTEDHQALW
ncbi:MAG: DUF2804 domain-containing protein [Myxococcota bacterium]